jgi:hypothetical protein
MSTDMDDPVFFDFDVDAEPDGSPGRPSPSRSQSPFPALSADAPPVALSEDQGHALAAITEKIKNSHEPAVLVGAAGTGKTTVMRAFLASMPSGQQVICACPTWKAALRFKDAAGREASSVHRVIYGPPLEEEIDGGKVNLQFFLRKGSLKGQIPWKSLLIVDECSMLGTKVYADIMRVVDENNARVLFVGDKCQLQPVNDTWGVDFYNPTASLTRVHRQAEASVPLRFVTAIREGQAQNFRDWDDTCQWVDGPSMEYIEQFVSACALPEFAVDRTMIAYTNELRQGLNRMARGVYGLEAPLVPGEPLLSFSNTAGLVNGEQATVLSAAPICRSEDDQVERALNAVYTGRNIDILRVEVDTGFCRKRLFVFPALLQVEHKQVTAARNTLLEPFLSKLESANLLDERGRPISVYTAMRRGARSISIDLLNAFFAIADVQYGYALTAHKAQGSQWKQVMVFVDRSLRGAAQREGQDFMRRWLYTAASRCQTHVKVCGLR